MAATSTMLPLGTAAPDFQLPDVVTGRTVRRDDFSDRAALLVVFTCNHCPYVKHLEVGIAAFARDYADADLAIVAIAPNDVSTYPEDAPEALAARAGELGFEFPYLYDESQEVAAAFTAMCTPDFFLFGPDRMLAYRGRFDESRPNSGKPVTGRDLRAAVDAVLAGEPVSEDQWPSMGCSIKWKDGNTPAYAF
ncbi:MAG: thioredoxin family protein [Acidimicrobiia bacterium]